MEEYTKNLNLKKPDVNEYYDIEKNNENMDLIDTAVGELNKNMIKYLDITYILPNLTWKKSAYGMYYCDDIVVENVSLILGINIIGFNGIRATDVIIPIISSDGSKVRFISNVNSFAGNETNIKVRIIYK